MEEIRILDVDAADPASFDRVPPCADARFDHRTCDYWEDADQGSNHSRPAWLQRVEAPPSAWQPPEPENPFAPPRREPSDNPFRATPGTGPSDTGVFGNDDAVPSGPFGPFGPFGIPEDNPFAPRATRERPITTGVPRKLALLDRGRGVFGSYGKVLVQGDVPAAWCQFGPLSAYPRARRLRDLYPQLPSAPLPAVITCIATTAEARRQRLAYRLVHEVCGDLAGRGFSAVEAYPDLTRGEDEQSAGRPAFWHACGFATAVADERFPVMRREL